MFEIQNINEVCEFLDNTFKKSCDLSKRYIKSSNLPVFIYSFSNYCDKKYIAEELIRPLSENKEPVENQNQFLSLLFPVKFSELYTKDDLVRSVLDGNAAIICYIENAVYAFGTEAKSNNGRSISEPNTDIVVRGPREGFVESAETNIALIRKKIKNPSLCVEKTVCGQNTGTEVFIVYLEGIAKEESIAKVKSRLLQMSLSSCLDSGYIEPYLYDKKYPVFPEAGTSEKPDKVAAKILGGRIAIFCDGSPAVITIPYFFIESLQSAEDYLKSPYFATFSRIIRFAAMFFSLFLPGIYLALLEHHTSAIPYKLYMTIAASRENIPFSLATELLGVLLMFEIIREVGIRMPKVVGDAVSIVASIIIGDAAIEAGIASAPVIIIAALSATCSFINPPFMNSVPLIRIIILVFARLFGIFGIMACLTFIICALAGKTSLGRPYLLPITPIIPGGISDTLIMLPKKALKHSENEIDTE